MKDKTAPRPSPKDVPAHAAGPTRQALRLTDFYDPKTDPSGSYTGRPVEKGEKPVQDVDDL